MSVLCIHCGSSSYKKNGTYKGVQRYRCQDCKRFFSDSPRKFTYKDKQKAIDMYLNNVGIRKTARFMGASPALIVRWIKSFAEQISRQLSVASQNVFDNKPDIIEMDEIYTFVQKSSKEPLYGVLIAGNRVALLPITSAKE